MPAGRCQPVGQHAAGGSRADDDENRNCRNSSCPIGFMRGDNGATTLCNGHEEVKPWRFDAEKIDYAAHAMLAGPSMRKSAAVRPDRRFRRMPA